MNDSTKNGLTVDGFSELDIELMVYNGVAHARCANCGDEIPVEPDARNCDCPSCGAKRTVTSPLIKLGLI